MAPGWSSCRTTRTAARRSSSLFERIVAEEGQRLIGWREVPTDNSALGPSAVAVQPVFRQILIGRGPGLPAPAVAGERDAAFERKLFVIRKRIEHAVDALDVSPSGSSSTSSACRRGR